MTTLWCELAWLGGEQVESGVVLELVEDRIAGVVSGVDTPPAGAEKVEGLTLPGLVNAHSHAFQRALRGRAESGPGSFWTWRERMYELAGTLDPDHLYRLARAAYGEMALAGITHVGEFHYLHHSPGGAPYDDPNEMGRALVRAAAEAGLRLSLVDACYLAGGIGKPLEGAQLRFGDGDWERWAARVEELENDRALRVMAAIHSVRAVPAEQLRPIAEWVRQRGWELHVHLSEQPAENQACREAYGLSPTGLLAREGAVDWNLVAVHATHLEPADLALLGDAGARVCLCPTTERDLADGVGRAAAMREAGISLALGSDSNAVVDLFEEARAVELDERLVAGRRGLHPAVELLRAATEGGAHALCWGGAGSLGVAKVADLAVLGLDSVRLAGARREDLLEAVVYAAAPADVRHVMMGGEWIVRDGRHLRLDVAAELAAAIPR